MEGSNRLCTVPNLLSLARLLLLIPIALLLLSGSHWIALGLMIAAGLTDMVDGYLARRLNQQSDAGRILDPVSDKIGLLTVMCILVFSPLYRFPLWYFLFLLSRELLIMLGALIVIGKKSTVMESNWPGKASAALNGLVLLLSVMKARPLDGWAVWPAFLLTLYSTVLYARLFFLKAARKKV